MQTEPPQHARPKLVRTSTHKVRTGCIACKKRRIKCDEAKPHCDNCLKSRGHCEGYVVTPATRKPRGPGQLCWDSRQVTRAAPPTTQLQLNTDPLDFRDATAMAYFQEFVDLVQGPWIAMAFNGNLWKVTLPQLARSNSTLRCAAMGIGALCMWHRQSKYGTLRASLAPSLPGAGGDAHYFHAVACYCHSLRLQSRKTSIQDAVCLSVLLLTFETLRGNRMAALDHVNHGLALLLALLTDEDAHRHVATLAPNPKSLLRAVADVFTPLAMQARSILRGRIGHCLPLPNFTEGLRAKKQTMESFMALVSKLPRSSADIDRIPAAFNNLDEFEAYWITVQHRQTTIGPIMLEIIQTSGVLGSNDDDDINSFWLDLFKNPRINEFCENTNKLMQALDSAFLPLFNRIIMSDAESQEYMRAIHLRLQYLGVYIFENTPQYLDIDMIHSRTSLFREYVSLADMAICAAKRESENPAHQLSLQCDLSWRLFTVAFFCRDPLVREEALWKLKDYPGYDGLWNTHSLYILALRNRYVERVNVAEGTPMEQWHRLWRREYVFEDGGDRILFRYLDKDGLTGEWQLVEEATQSQGNSEGVHWKRQPLRGSGRPLMADLISS
ncbi:hypothetical protein B0O99DRAFT_557019 [Bisporella sp. PMI_857]|nr:hypothetical protein B0O99DRAFT_557019 [Bisporella sp. PMI_857]